MGKFLVKVLSRDVVSFKKGLQYDLSLPGEFKLILGQVIFEQLSFFYHVHRALFDFGFHFQYKLRYRSCQVVFGGGGILLFDR